MDASTLFSLFALVLLCILFLRGWKRRSQRLDGVITRPQIWQWKPVAWVYLACWMGLWFLWFQDRPFVLAEPVPPTSLPTQTTQPTHTVYPTLPPTATLLPTATRLIIPTTGVVWNPTGEGVYLWQTPGQTILAWVENGALIQFLDVWEPFGGQAWAQVVFQAQTGWVDAAKLLRVTIPKTGLIVVAGEGSFLYAHPQGQPLTWLTPGTPVEITSSQTNAPGWVQVSLPNQEAGWIQEIRLQTLIP